MAAGLSVGEFTAAAGRVVNYDVMLPRRSEHHKVAHVPVQECTGVFQPGQIFKLPPAKGGWSFPQLIGKSR